jgi:hypothetical protein
MERAQDDGALRAAAPDASHSGASGAHGCAAGGARAAASEGSAGGPPAALGDVKQCAPAAAASASRPEALLGRRVLRAFADGDCVGVVLSARLTQAWGLLYTVRYTVDDAADATHAEKAEEEEEEEELSLEELCPLLLPVEEAAAPPPPAAAPARADAGAERRDKRGCSAAGDDEAPGAGGAGSDEAAPAAARRYKGVYAKPTGKPGQQFVAQHCGRHLGYFGSAAEGARAYDDAARAAGYLLVNFPRPGTDETLALPNKRRNNGAPEAPPPEAQQEAPLPQDEPSPPHVEAQQPPPPPPPAARELRARDAPDFEALRASALAFKGVHLNGILARSRAFHARVSVQRGVLCTFGPFATALQAARAYDAAARAHGKLQLNFPRPGTDEVRAVPRRRGCAQRNAIAPQAPALASAASARQGIPPQRRPRRARAAGVLARAARDVRLCGRERAAVRYRRQHAPDRRVRAAVGRHL